MQLMQQNHPVSICQRLRTGQESSSCTVKNMFECPLTLDGELLHSTPLSSAAVRWQAEATDAAACSHARAQDVV